MDAIAQGTTEITTERMKNELAYKESGKEMAWKSSEAAMDRYYTQKAADTQADAVDKANKWNLFGNIGAGLVNAYSNDDDNKWGWSDLF